VRTVLTILLGLILPTTLAAQGLSPSLREELARSVVQVQGSGCPTPQGTERRVATGFAYGPAGHVVTANHVVTGCQRITVYWEKHNGHTQQASVVRVLPKADLALLQVGQSLGTALTAQPQRPKVDAEVETLGYYLSVPTMSNKRLRVTYGSSRLADMVPKETRQALQQSGAIDVNLDILRLDGHLLPGHSGAPIFDLQGHVVGVGSGGLKSGAASVSWAVPASYLAALLTSQEQQGDSRTIANLFAYSAGESGGNTGGPTASPGGSPQSMQAMCGGVQFIYTGLRSFAELLVGHEDLGSVQKLMIDFELSEQEVSAFRYHTFQPVDGGAAVAIPDWMSIRDTGQVCRALNQTGRISIDFASQTVQSLQEAQLVSQQFENSFAYRSGRQWVPNVDYSYLVPYQRDDGLVVTRRTFEGLNSQFVPSIAFETLLLHQPPRTHTGTFTGVIGAYWDVNLQATTYCETQPQDPDCAPVIAEAQQAAQMIFGVLLSTAPRI
jgi:hypothetical protein